MALGLRARVAANLAAAASLTFGLLFLSVFFLFQRTLREQAWQDAERTADAAISAAVAHGCAGESCADVVARSAPGWIVSATLLPTPRCGSCTRRIAKSSGPAMAVERPLGTGAIEVEVTLAEAAHRAREAVGRLALLLLLNALALVAIATVLLERGVVRRLGRVHQAVAQVERLELEQPFFIAEEGDEIGRMAGSVRRMAERLREDKRQTQAYIEELERTNRQLRETQEGLARSERLATVGRLAAGVAHEIGNPVAAVLGYLDVLKLRKDALPKEYAERIEREVRRVDRIVRDLLDFARPAPLQAGPVSLAHVVGTAARLVQPQPRWKQMQLEVALPPGLPLVRAQEHYLAQVLVNLLINAADACGGRGLVRLSARQDGAAVELTVADDGPGIAPRDLPRVFDPFFTTKAPGEGVGLGLSICHRLMEAFGGSIRAESAQGRGAAFTLRFLGEAEAERVGALSRARSES